MGKWCINLSRESLISVTSMTWMFSMESLIQLRWLRLSNFQATTNLIDFWKLQNLISKITWFRGSIVAQLALHSNFKLIIKRRRKTLTQVEAKVIKIKLLTEIQTHLITLIVEVNRSHKATKKILETKMDKIVQITESTKVHQIRILTPAAQAKRDSIRLRFRVHKDLCSSQMERLLSWIQIFIDKL